MPSLDIDINATHAAFGITAGTGRFRPRYNSGVFTKRIKSDDMLVPPAMVKKEAGDTIFPGLPEH
jgi:hypothetical protein